MRQTSHFKFQTSEAIAKATSAFKLLSEAESLGEVKMVSTAFEPQSPIGPNKRKNVTLAGVISLMLGTFAAFFLEIWQKTEEMQKN